MIRTIEELSLNSWPSLQNMFYDGWVLRFARGFTRRSNSISPLYSPGLDIDEKIRFCEGLYREKDLDCIFKLTPSVYPVDLDSILEAGGYRVEAPTSVQVLDLTGGDFTPDEEAVLRGAFSDSWLDGFCEISGIPEPHKSTLGEILLRIVPATCFASIRESGLRFSPLLACGIGVVQGSYMGLYDIVTGEQYRRRGYGRRIVMNLLNFGKSRGVKTVYLHVLASNEPAFRLYSGLGFKEIYRYWYRIK